MVMNLHKKLKKVLERMILKELKREYYENLLKENVGKTPTQRHKKELDAMYERRLMSLIFPADSKAKGIQDVNNINFLKNYRSPEEENDENCCS